MGREWVREDLVLGQVSTVKRSALAFGEADAAGTAIEQSILLGLAQSAGEGEVSGVSATEVGALGIQATELSEVVHGLRSGPEREERMRLGALL
jgi:hypothetical protein